MGLGALRRLIHAAPLAVTLLGLVWTASLNPLTAPYVDRSAQDLSLTMERAVRRTASGPWITAALAEAVAAKDAERAEMLLSLADDLGRDVPRSAAEAMIARQLGILAQAEACGACMVDIALCDSLQKISLCAAPFEMSPLGDLNALRRATQAWATGAEVDRLDASLALLGLGATGAVLVSGGSSATVKAGASFVRMARRMGSVRPGLTDVLRVPIRWGAVPGYLAGTARLGDVTDPLRAARAARTVRDIDRVRAATSTPDALRLLRLVDSPGDANRLARVAEVMGPKTARTAEVLGKSRLMRATVRLSRAAAGMLILLGLALVQMAAAIGSVLGHAALRAGVRAI